MKVEACRIPGALVITPRTFRDDRGLFYESHHAKRYRQAGIIGEFVQDNRSVSKSGVLRGMHYQITAPQGHLVTLTRGRIFDVGLDLRRDSSTFGEWQSFELTADPPVQLFWPPGVAHGFCVLSDGAEIWYKCVGYFKPDDEGGVVWNDPDLAIPWPLRDPVITPRDAAFPRLKDVPENRFPCVPG